MEAGDIAAEGLGRGRLKALVEIQAIDPLGSIAGKLAHSLLFFSAEREHLLEDILVGMVVATLVA